MEPDERSPLLLNTSRSRIRMDGAPSPRIPQISRNHSYTGMVSQLVYKHTVTEMFVNLEADDILFQAAHGQLDTTAGMDHGDRD